MQWRRRAQNSRLLKGKTLASAASPKGRSIPYLEWFAGDHSEPNAYIGYVFLYFYGLERRLMLERNAPDAAVVAEEVRRLVDVCGGNHSFNRYATELLTAAELRSGEPSAYFLAHVEPNGYEVPTAIRIALGARVRDDRIMEPDLLYRFAMTYPEMRVRTPAKRAPELMQQLFAQYLLKEYPWDFRYKAARRQYPRHCPSLPTYRYAARSGAGIRLCSNPLCLHPCGRRAYPSET